MSTSSQLLPHICRHLDTISVISVLFDALMRHVLQSCSLALRTAPNDLPRFDLLLWPGSITNPKFGNTQKRPRWAKDCIAPQTHKLRTACSAERSGQGACTWSCLCCRFYFDVKGLGNRVHKTIKAESYHPTRIEMSTVRRIGISMSMRAVGCQPTGWKLPPYKNRNVKG